MPVKLPVGHAPSFDLTWSDNKSKDTASETFETFETWKPMENRDMEFHGKSGFPRYFLFVR